MPRIARTIAVGYPHHVTQRGNNRQAIFDDDTDRSRYLALVEEHIEEHRCRLWTYCLMPNHVHFLMVPEREDSLARCFHGITSRYTRYFNQKNKRTGRIWENRYYSCIVDKEHYLWAVARYIERNPVRGGLVNDPAAYRWSSARTSILGEENRLITTSWFESSERKRYAEFLKGDDTNQNVRIRKCTVSGKPLGTETFLSGLENILGRKFHFGRRGRPIGH